MSNATPIASAIATDRDKRAALTAKLDIIAGNLPPSAVQIAIASVVLLACLDVRITGFGMPTDDAHFAWLAAQMGIVALFFAVHRFWPPGAGIDRFGLSRSTVYAALYFVSGAAWGALTWVAIIPGDILNQVFVVLIVICLSMVYIVRLTAYTPVFFAANAGLFLVAMPNSFVIDNGLSRLMAFAGPCWLALLGTAAWRLGSQIGAMLEMRLREGDLAARLADAHARAEAESQSKSAFLANMSHELRTPLNAIIGFSDVMRSELFGALDGRYRGYAEDIHLSGAHLLSLINDVLDIAKIESGAMELFIEPLDTADIASQVMRLLSGRAAEKNQTLTLSLDGAPAAIRGDSRALKQILLNLAGNALKYTQERGAIEVSIRADGSDVVLGVSDNGPGIATEKQARLFRPFERIDNSYLTADAGTGLGLSLVRALSALHGGTASIDSAPGRGTRVSVRLPGAVVQPGTARAA